MIWSECHGEQHIRSISGVLFRLAENQEQVATRSYVDTLDEQALLEDMLERVKPDYLEDISNLHYLLKSPFRYPPLSHGSRFGRTNEPSIFYGAVSVKTTLFEIAYYRFLFIHSIEGTTPDESISSQHTIFSINYRSNNGIQLQNPPFNAYVEKLRDSVNYSYTQELGSAMRNADVDVFEYESARDPDRGICIGLFNSSPFVTEQPNEMTAWFCEASLKMVAFKQMDNRDIYHFPIEYFLVNDEIPIPAD